MRHVIRSPKDLWSGAIFLSVGLAAVIIGRDYSMGSAGRMGPAYFPTILGCLLALVGVVAIARSMIRSGEPVGRMAVREILLVLSSVVLFGILVRGAGLAASVILLVMVGGYASLKFKLLPNVALAIGLAAFSSLVFVKALGLPMPMFGPWLGF